MSTTAHQPADLALRVLKRERRAIAQALSLVEERSAHSGALLATLAPGFGHACVIGLTGPPGAGKSTLVNAMIATLRSGGRRVGVLAVDPSSPLTGGAILGDQIRMTAALDDDGVMVRSLGARGALGGLTPAAVRMIDVLDAAGFDDIVMETVGTGQSEVDIAEIADAVGVVAAPGLGDGIQAMKAGLLELADVVIVNKADLPGAHRTAEELGAALAGRAEPRTGLVLQTSAMTGQGVAEVVGALHEAAARHRGGGDIIARRRRRIRYLVARAAAEIVAQRIKHSAGAELDALCDQVLAGDLAPEAAAGRLLSG
ncbi:MAG: methylmalonyl Co-A mutase-associated GTPase MeaB [Hyphomicrobiaceae bacterium]